MVDVSSAHGGAEPPAASDLSAATVTLPSDFESLYVGKYADLVRLAYVLTGSMAQAEEAAQESFIRLYERWNRVDNHPAYLRANVLNHCRSWHRSRLAALRRDSRLDRNGRHIDQPDELADALAKLPRRRRQVVVLRYYEGLTIADIAELLGISEGTVKSTLHRGLNELKGALDE